MHSLNDEVAVIRNVAWKPPFSKHHCRKESCENAYTGWNVDLENSWLIPFCNPDCVTSTSLEGN